MDVGIVFNLLRGRATKGQNNSEGHWRSEGTLSEEDFLNQVMDEMWDEDHAFTIAEDTAFCYAGQSKDVRGPPN